MSDQEKVPENLVAEINEAMSNLSMIRMEIVVPAADDGLPTPTVHVQLGGSHLYIDPARARQLAVDLIDLSAAAGYQCALIRAYVASGLAAGHNQDDLFTAAAQFASESEQKYAELHPSGWPAPKLED